MTDLRHSNRVHPRCGFSLMELLLVLGIMVVVSAAATPQLMSMIRESAVFEASDKVRETMGEARRYAIDTGIDYEFRYEINGPSIVVLPAENELNLDESGTTSTTTERYMRLSLDLPESMQLRGAAGVDEVSENLEPERLGDLPSNLAEKSWSAPVVFRFDGTVRDFELRVSDKSGLTSKVRVRGLTGAARTTAVFQEEF